MTGWVAGLLLSVCLAHPFGARFAAHLTSIEVHEDRIELAYTADVPNPVVATATRLPDEDPMEAMANELRYGLLLEVDGQSVALQASQPWTVVPTEDTQRFTLPLTAVLSARPTTVRFSNGNLPDVAAVYRARVDAVAPLHVVESSLWRMQNGEIALDQTDRWRTDERHRVLEVRVAPQATLGPWWSLGFVALLGLGISGTVALRGRSQPAPAR